jgi:hypothetical protein
MVGDRDGVTKNIRIRPFAATDAEHSCSPYQTLCRGAPSAEQRPYQIVWAESVKPGRLHDVRRAASASPPSERNVTETLVGAPALRNWRHTVELGTDG